jgi:hypothetical protein
MERIYIQNALGLISREGGVHGYREIKVYRLYLKRRLLLLPVDFAHSGFYPLRALLIVDHQVSIGDILY